MDFYEFWHFAFIILISNATKNLVLKLKLVYVNRVLLTYVLRAYVSKLF